ncbi:MAG: potassium transporter TrkA [Coleofasciculaceae cyanobacterium SM2_1_6]|nr:potassium transporter TrkA [Coleofasciculaceae cyanobacterium SM2_1_6]
MSPKGRESLPPLPSGLILVGRFSGRGRCSLVNSSPSLIQLDQFLVCGLGSLGQHCVVALKEFGIKVTAIALTVPTTWEIPQVPDLLEGLILGDCREQKFLEEAQIQQYRAVLLVTGSDRTNAEAAFAIRLLNPDTRLVVRSEQENLNQLLGEALGNFIAFEPTQLPATAFALAAIGSEVAGFFHLDGQSLRVVNVLITAEHRWCNSRLVHELDTRNRRILFYLPKEGATLAFHHWHPHALIQAGDRVVYAEITENFQENFISPRANSQKPSNASHPRRRSPHAENVQSWQSIWQLQYLAAWLATGQQKMQQKIRTWTHQYIASLRRSNFQKQIYQVTLICGLTVVLLLLLGTSLFLNYYPNTDLYNAFLMTAILLLGGYADLHDNFQESGVPWWFRLLGLTLTLAGTAFVGVLYALLTQALLSSRLQFLQSRPPVPLQDHVVLIGLDAVGQKVAQLLQEFQQPVVGIALGGEAEVTSLPQMPLITGNLLQSLPKANLSTARSVIAITGDEMLNLEAGLMVRRTNPHSYLVIRTFAQRLSDNLSQLLPQAHILCAYALTAEAFAGAAFGEKILSLFRLSNQTILVTEYNIESADTLCGLLLSEVAYGYGVVPILAATAGRGESRKLMPSEELRLAVGDRLVVLATIDGLRRIEQGRITPKQWRVQVDQALTTAAAFEGANLMARITGCSLSMARDLMDNLPGVFRSPLYHHQALRLVRELGRIQVNAQVVPIQPK